MIDTAIKLQALQERFKSKTEIEMVKALDGALENVIAKLAQTEDLPQIKRLKTLKAMIEKEISDLYGEATKPIKEDMAGFAKVSHKTMFEQLNGTIGLGYAFAGIPKDTINAITNLDEIILMDGKGYTINELFKTSSENQINRYKQIINSGLASNSGYKEITKRLKMANETGMTEIQAIVHTAISYARNQADGVAFDRFDSSIVGWKSSAVLDSRTTFICASLDGEKYFKKNGITWNTIPNRPPRHFRCRTVMVPLTDFEDGDGTRSANGDKKGQVPAKLNFQSWFDKQSDAFKKKYLGPARFELYKSGKFKISSFVDVKTGQKFTLDEIEGMVKPVKVVAKEFSGSLEMGFGPKVDKLINQATPQAKQIINRLDKPKNMTVGRNGVYYPGSNHLESTNDHRTMLHEYGHHIDRVLGMKTNAEKYFSGILAEARKADFDFGNFQSKDVLESYRNVWFEKVELRYQRGPKKGRLRGYTYKAKKDEHNAFSDIVDSLTGGRFFNEFYCPGHGKEYYKRSHAREAENFANLFSIWSDGKRWEEATALFPNLTREFEKILKDIEDGKFD